MRITKKSIVLLFFLLSSAYLLKAQQPQNQVIFVEGESAGMTFPMDVATIISNKCYGCHSPNSKNEKAKEKLKWVDLQSMEAIDLVGALEEVHEVLEEGTMPPDKMLERYPNMKLTEEEVATLKAWVDALQTKLMNE